MRNDGNGEEVSLTSLRKESIYISMKRKKKTVDLLLYSAACRSAFSPPLFLLKK
jgi:hypothetical protein